MAGILLLRAIACVSEPSEATDQPDTYRFFFDGRRPWPAKTLRYLQVEEFDADLHFFNVVNASSRLAFFSASEPSKPSSCCAAFVCNRAACGVRSSGEVFARLSLPCGRVRVVFNPLVGDLFAQLFGLLPEFLRLFHLRFSRCLHCLFRRSEFLPLIS